MNVFITIKRPVWRSASHAEAMRLLLEVYAYPIANKSVSDITADDVESTVRAGSQQDRTLRAIREVLNLAMSRDLITSNPADHRIMKYRLPNGRKLPTNFKSMDYHEPLPS
jgi:hypothetical protein